MIPRVFTGRTSPREPALALDLFLSPRSASAKAEAASADPGAMVTSGVPAAPRHSHPPPGVAEGCTASTSSSASASSLHFSVRRTEPKLPSKQRPQPQR